MANRHPKHWLEEIVHKIEKRNQDMLTLATGKTPSGQVHIGILREVLICDSLRRLFENNGKEVKFYLFLDSLDAAKRFPNYIPKEFQKKHIGKPFSLIPCPYDDCECESYAHHFGLDLTSTFDDFGIVCDTIWTHELYKKKEMQKMIKIALENNDRIKEILKKYILPTLDDIKKKMFIEMQKTWFPVMVICEECSKILFRRSDNSIEPNRISSFIESEGKITYECNACGHKGALSIYSGRLKLNWRIDWPAKWALFNTSCEPAGKDHSVKGGAYDTGLEICREIFKYQGPIKVPYEWLRLGNRDMKTSKGIVFTPKKYLEIADPEIYRMLILRTNPLKHISFRIEEIPQYNDYFEKMEATYYQLEEQDLNEEEELMRYIYPLSKISSISKNKPNRLSFKVLVFLSQIQNLISFEKLYEKALTTLNQSDASTEISKEEFNKLIRRTENWLSSIKEILENERDKKIKRAISQKVSLFEIPDVIDQSIKSRLNEKQINGLKHFTLILENRSNIEPEQLQNHIFKIAKEKLDLAPRKLFEAIYLVVLGKKNGPRLGPFLAQLDREWLIRRLKSVN